MEIGFMASRNPRRVCPPQVPVNARIAVDHFQDLPLHAGMAYLIEEEECLGRVEIEALQLQKFHRMTGELAMNRFYADKFASHAPGDIASLEEFRSLPFTTKDEVTADQEQNPPYGTNLSYPIDRYTRLHQTSGTSGQRLRWLDTPESWAWWTVRLWGIIYRAAGVTAEDRLFFPFSFGPFIGFWAAFEGAQQLDNFCVSGGGMSTAVRIAILLEHNISFVCCTPTYALRMCEVAAEQGIDLAGGPVRGLIVAGEPGGAVPAVRGRIEEGWGARVFDHAGMTEIGALGIECVEQPMVTRLIESECIAEVIDPDSGETLPDGAEGELVLTNLGRWGSPLIRYRTGDRVCLTAEPCPSGRGFRGMAGGILGRQDDMFFVKGNNVYPSSVEDIVRSFPEILEFQMQVRTESGLTVLNIEIEAAAEAAADLADQLSDRVCSRLNFTPTVKPVKIGSLPRFEAKARRITFAPAAESQDT
jgi:phenylacetate-CoA ligase